MSYRTIFSLVVMMACTTNTYSQKSTDSTVTKSGIIGVWQANTSTVSSTLQPNFQFFKTGRFIYNINGYDDLNPLYNISGSYKIENGNLYLKIEEFKELKGFKVVESSPGFQFGSFVLDSGKVITVKQNDKSYSEHGIYFVKANKSGDKKCISVDNIKYFKLSDDPNKYSSLW